MPDFEIIRAMKTDEVDELGDPIYRERTAYELSGWLDLITGSDEQAYQNSLIPTSSHVFLTEDLSFEIESTDKIKDVQTGINYEITFVDNVMGLNDHYEIYCKRWT